MARAESQHVLNNGSYYAWLVCDYEMNGSTLEYNLWFHWDWGCAQLDNAWIKVGNTTIWSNGGRIHNYAAGDIAQNHSCAVHSGSATITGTQTVTFGITKYQGVDLSGSFTVTGAVPVHLYGSVNGARKEIKHLYGSVNGSRKKIKKLYASVNGARKLIFRDDS